MDIKKAPGGAARKPLIHYSGREKNVNPYIMQSEIITLVNTLVYGEFTRDGNEFVDMRHKNIYSNLESFCGNYPPSQRSCDSFTGYLKETGVAENCGGESYVRGIFQGIGGSGPIIPPGCGNGRFGDTEAEAGDEQP